MARIGGPTGEPAVPNQIASVTLEVWDDAEPEDGTPIDEVAIADPSDVFFATLQTDPRWTRDDVGYNFAYQALATHLPAGRRKYRFEFRCTTTEGIVFDIVFLQPTLPMKSR